MKITAILVVRNEEDYIEETIKHLAGNGVSVAIIDNESTDRTVDICRKYYPENVTNMATVPFDGTFNLQSHLSAGRRLLETVDADWIISQAADERVVSPVPGETVHDAIARVSALGFDVINLEEFVFVYENNTVDYRGRDYCKEMQTYYFFEPCKLRLMRIFRKTVPVDGILAGVHQLTEKRVKLYDGNFVLQHYPALGYRHAIEKYLSRTYSKREVDMGWHRNRISMTERNLAAPKSGFLKRRASPTESLDRSSPCTRHFWEW